MKPPSTRSKGRAVEMRLRLWLEAKGYVIVAQNYQAGRQELDLVGTRGTLLVFFEIKSRKAGSSIHPHRAIGRRKQQHLVLASRIFLHRHPEFQTHYARYDAVFAINTGGDERIEHFENAFLAS